jgi:hypothetical protein
MMKTLLARFFADVAMLCGHEKNLHSAFCHQLLLSGIPKTGFAQEYRLNPMSSRRTDVVLFEESGNASFPASIKPRIAMEFKGGAYGTRNALHDTIGADGRCADLDKLLPHRMQGIECWFICVDAIELGISLSPVARKRLAARCSQLGINFAYHAQNEPTFLFCQDGVSENYALAIKSTNIATQDIQWRDCLSCLPQLMLNHSASEDTYTGLLYHALRRTGFGADQLSIETYFNCGAHGSRMAKRPDMCIFGKEVNGRFNLYRRGIKNQSNDEIKIRNLQAVVEVKGSSATERLSDKAFAKQIWADIDKLMSWRACFHASGYMNTTDAKSKSQFIMLAIDNRIRPMPSSTLAPLRQMAGAEDIKFHYVCR